MTEYVVFTNTTGAWKEIGRLQARSARSAIRERIDGMAQTDAYLGEGQYVAVPSRSWQPVTVHSETKTALRFS